MPKKSKKSKSKRMTLRHKHKVIKKVKEHHRKLAKTAKKQGKKKQAPKDPGIPSQWPFKEQLIQELQAKQQAILAAEQQRKEERKRQREAPAAGDADMADAQGRDVAQLQEEAAAKLSKFEGGGKKRRVDGSASADKDNSRRAFYKEFARVVEASDVIVQVLDARDPLGCRCPEVERFVRDADPNKRVVLLLNKIDLVPREVAAAWVKYLRLEVPTVAFKCSTQKQATKLGQRALPAGGAAEAGSECLGAEGLLQLLKNYSRSLDIKTAITVGVVGLPNVGKSSLINSLKRARVAAVGNAPGVTKAMQAVALDKHLRLLDCPGIVFAAEGDDVSGAALRNAVRVEKLEDPVAPVASIVSRCPARQLMAEYSVPSFDTPEQFLAHVAAARGKLKKGGALDIEAAARQVLQDWNDGRLRYYTLPPVRPSADVAGSATVVSDWAPAFDAEAAASAVIAGLPSLEDEDGAVHYFQTASAGPVDTPLVASAMEAEAEGEGEGEGIEAMDEREGGGAMPVTGRLTAAAKSQASKLYTEEGQFNPHAARAERKRRKKAGQDGPTGDDEEGSDYEFAAAWSDAEDDNVYAQLGQEGEDDPAEEDEAGDEDGDGMSGSDVE